MPIDFQMDTREKVMHAVVFTAVIVLYLAIVSGVLLTTAFMASSPTLAYAVILLASLGLGYLVYYVMKEKSSSGHVTEAGLLLPVPAVIDISITMLVVEKTVQIIRNTMPAIKGTAEGTGASANLVQLFNTNMPNFIALSILAYAAFNIPLVYLLVKRGEKKELLWFLLAPVILAVLLFAAYALVNTAIGTALR